MNIIDIFIRTYTKDFDILKYCLYSIEKYVSGYRNIIIIVKENEYTLLKDIIDINKYKVFTTHNYTSLYAKYNNVDYCGQQIDKLNADLYTDAEYILYIDCDVIFYNEINLYEVCFDNNKLILFKTLWKDVGDATCWQKCLKRLDLLTDYEYMRRLPQLLPTKYLKDIRNYIENKMQNKFIYACLDIYEKDGFSEFNIIGSYIDKYHNNDLNFNINLCFPEEYINSKYNYNKTCVVQFWSHTEKEQLLHDIRKTLQI